MLVNGASFSSLLFFPFFFPLLISSIRRNSLSPSQDTIDIIKVLEEDNKNCDDSYIFNILKGDERDTKRDTRNGLFIVGANDKCWRVRGAISRCWIQELGIGEQSAESTKRPRTMRTMDRRTRPIRADALSIAPCPGG